MTTLSFRTQIAQVPEEINRFIEILTEERVTSYLEIGSKFGGSLWKVATSLPPGSRVTSVDLPRGTKLWRQSEQSLLACVGELKRLGYDARIVWGDSTDPHVVSQVTVLGPVDACFIDANHTLPYVVKDVANYGPLTRILALHDVAWRRQPEWRGIRIDAPIWWNEHKVKYRHEEIKLCPTGKNNGIGVLWL